MRVLNSHLLFLRLAVPFLIGASVLFGSVLIGASSGDALAQGKNPKKAIKKFDRDSGVLIAGGLVTIAYNIFKHSRMYFSTYGLLDETTSRESGD